MSTNWSIICLDTAEMLDLGKMIRSEFEKCEFSKLQSSEAPEKALLNLQCLVHFLIRNRGRNLSLVEDMVHGESEHLPSNRDTYVLLDAKDYIKFLELPLGLDQAFNASASVAKRLDELRRGEKIEKLPWSGNE